LSLPIEGCRWDGLNVREKSRRSTSRLILLGLSIVCCSCQRSSYNVTGLQIDAQHHLNPIGKKSLDKPSSGSYYLFFHTATGLTIVTHWTRKAGESDFRNVLYLETNKDKILDRTVKDDVIIAGTYGTLISKRECFYARPINEGLSGVQVEIASNNYPSAHEMPSELPMTPKEMPSLTSLSLVRVFRESPGFTVVSANFEADGTLGTLNLGQIAQGDLMPGSHTSARPSDFDPDLKKYGIPSRMDVHQYVGTGRLQLIPVPLPQETAIVILHYGFGKLMRQDTLEGGAVISSRFLQPGTTEEEKRLDPECDQRFRQQQSKGLPTTFVM
jgi:hypothetical protein